MKWSLSRLFQSRSKPSHRPPGQQPRQPTQQLCLRCEAFVRHFFSKRRSIPSSFNFTHGTLQERSNSAREGCQLCEFSIRVSEDDLVTEIKGSQNEQATVYWTAALEFFDPGLSASDHEAATLNESYRTGFQYPEWENASELQREAPRRTDDPECFELVQTWIHKCCSRHPICSRASITRLPTRVISVGVDGDAAVPFLLETSGETGPYVALSHRWEQNLSFKTTMANLESHKVALETLPATFRDAVVVCRKVGIRFLWIDAVCIIQDSTEDCNREVAQMSSIYRHAVFTISALHSSSSHGGLFCERVRPPRVIFPSPVTGQGKPREIGMRVAAPTFGEEMSNSPLTPRGWIYQERALSTATLHFSKHQIIWECRNKVVSEYSSEIHGTGPDALTSDFGRCLLQLGPKSEAYPLKMRAQDQMDEWEYIVKNFSRTRFTKATDRFPAICGVAALFKDIIIDPDNTFIAGLWSAFLYRQLLWGLDGRTAPYILGPPVSHQTWCPPGWKPRLPSWSWISVDYPVSTWSAEEIPSLFRVVNIEMARLTSLASYLDGTEILELRVWGKLKWFEGPAREIYRPTPPRLPERCGQSLSLFGIAIDPECSVPERFAGLIVSKSHYIITPEMLYFLVLEQTGRCGSRFRRIGIGSGTKTSVEEIFEGGVFKEITLI
ncbi:HET domain containing protein [Hyaloscypha variabilis]